MWNRLKNRLPVRVGLFIAIAAIAFVLLSSVLAFFYTYQTELESTNLSLSQLAATVEASAAIAAYLDNRELAREVVNGLHVNDIVTGVALISDTGLREQVGAWDSDTEALARKFPLNAPFPPLEQVGELRILPNRTLIESRARQVARLQVLSMGGQSLVIVTLVILLVRHQLTHPIKSLAGSLHAIEPGSPQRLTSLKGHAKDEIGQLVDDSNHLLDSVQATLRRERELRAEVETLGKRFRLIFEYASSAIALVDRNGDIQIFNPAFAAMAGQDRIQGLQTPSHRSIFPLFADESAIRHALSQALEQTAPVSLDLQLEPEIGATPRWAHCLLSAVTDDAGNHFVECILYDISERTRRELRSRHEAEHDPLTQLHNRRAGERLIQAAIETAKEAGAVCAFLLIDLDKFKPINDTFGHDAGDQVLIEVARRLRASLRSSDWVIRWGGDEFLVLLTQNGGHFAPDRVADKLIERIAQPVDLGEGRIATLGASIGMALFPEHGEDAALLIELADNAMYRAKKQGRGAWEYSS